MLTRARSEMAMKKTVRILLGSACILCLSLLHGCAQRQLPFHVQSEQERTHPSAGESLNNLGFRGVRDI